MLFSLTNALTAFQQFMNNIFSNLLDVCIVIYLDNMLIYSSNMSEHHWHIKEVLKYFCKTSLYAKAEKCEFYSKLVEYLEYILSLSSLTMSDDKVKIIQDWLKLKKVKNIQFFLGFSNFYCWFIFNYLDIVIPLCHMPSLLIWKLHPHSDITSQLYKPTFYSGHLSYNMSYSSDATIQVFCLPWQRYSYLTQSSMIELLLSVS